MLEIARRLLRRPQRKNRDLSATEERILAKCTPYTMTSPERLVAVIDAVTYICARGIPGAFAECGVWRGGSVLAMLLTLQHLGRQDRDVYLFDTFEGMTRPGDHDVSPFERPALQTWNEARSVGKRPWEFFFKEELFNLAQVRDVLAGTSYPAERIHFVKGPVEETVPARAPKELALLRLDTDWYESTRHELEHLYPRLSRGGVLIVDDYGHWQGCRKAVDEYFTAHPVLLSRIDYTGRMSVKL